MALADNLLRVTITGRPNVGKSTLFNRLMQERIAITDSQPGATRDAIARSCSLNNQLFLLLDTGGCRPDAEGELEELSITKSLFEAKRADLVILVVDANELTAEDYLLIDQLRRYCHKLMLVANKCDSVEKELLAGDLYRLGLGEVTFISAEHNRGLENFYQLLSQRINSLMPPTLVPKGEIVHQKEQSIKIAMLGRPNVGKSSLANRLCGEENSIVSAIAGTTRDTVISNFESNQHHFELLDTAGLRRKAKVDERLEYFSSQRSEDAARAADIILLMIDAAEGLADQDKKIADIIVREKKPFIFVLNKWDLQEKNDPVIKVKGQSSDTLGRAIDQLHFDFPVLAYIPVIAVSATLAWGIDNLLASVVRLYSENHKKANELELNLALKEWTEERPPARRGRSTTWFKSLRQMGSAPARFTLRVHGHLDDSYLRFLQNKLRAEFGFKSVPLTLEVEHV